MIQVKNKNGEVILEQNESTYTGGFMAERSVSFSVESPRKIALDNESYVEYRGEIFVLQKTPVPTVKKISSPESIGNAFKYDFKFVSLADYELKATGFIDSVHGENSGYYSGSSTVEFRGNVSYLISRIQSCLDSKYYGDKAWNIILDDGIITDDVDISVTDITCWDALCLVNSTEAWGLNFFISGRNIHVTNYQDRIEYPFEYGLGNGLYELERSAVETDPIVTRLRVYGSTDNIPADYRRESGITGRIAPDSQYSKNLMLPDYAYIPEAKVHAKSKGDYDPDSAYEKGDLILSPQKEHFYCIKNAPKGTGLSRLEYFVPYKDNYIESANISIYGIRDGVFRDESIKPTISGITISDLEYYKVIPSNTGSKSRIDEILAVSAISTANENLATFDIWVRDIGFNVFSSNASGVSAKIEITSSPTGVSGFDFEVSACVEDTTSYPESKYKITLKKNTSESFVVPNAETNIYSLSDGVNLVPDGVYARFVVTDVAMPFFYIQSAERRLLESGENKLSTIDSPLSAYSLGIDEIEISRNRQDLRDSISEGNLIGVYDEDVSCGVLLSNNENFNTDIHPRWDDSSSNIVFGTNKFNLGIVPSGTRASIFSGIGKLSYIWTSDIYDANNAIAKKISFDSSDVESVFLDRNNGASVILVRDARSGEVGLDDGTIRYSVYKDSNNVIYDGVKIGNKVWLSSPLKESKYFNEDGSDSLFFNSQKYKYLHQYAVGTEYSIGESILKPSGINIAAPSGETAPNTDAYYYKSGSGTNDWTQLISEGCRYLGEYKTWIPYSIGDIVVSGSIYYKNIAPCTGIGVSDKTKWAVDNSYPNIRIDRLISGLNDAEWMSANFGALSAYPFSGVLPSEDDMVSEYGRLYNHYSVENPIGMVDSTTGFRVPSSTDFSSLENYIKSKYQSEASFGIGNLLKSKRQIGTPLDGGVSDIKLCQYISIQTLTIKEGFSSIPQYQITLSSKPIASKLDTVSSATKSNSDKIYTVASSAQTASKVVEKSIESVRAEIPSSPADTGSEPAITKSDGALTWASGAWAWITDYVRSGRKVNNKDLSADIVLDTSDIADTLDKRYQSDSQKLYNDATSSIQTQINAKQDTLVSGENIRTVNGSSILGSGNLSIIAGGGGAGANVYLSDVNSSVSGYKTSSPNIDASESVKTITASTPNTVYWGEKYLYTSPIATTNIPSGLWSLHAFGNVNSAVGVSSVVFRIFKYSGSTETVLFTFTGYEVDNIEASEIIVTGGGTETTLLSTDYLGVQVGFQTTAATAKTFTYTIGNGHASYSTNPLPLRHDGLRDKNGESDFQHVTTTQIGTWNGKQDALGFIPYNSSNPAGYTSNLGTVTNVSTYIDTAGNDIYVETSNSTTTPQINIHIPTASATKRGALSFADWNTFNNKLSAISYNQPSNASYQMLWGSGNNVYGNSNITCNPYTGVLSATQFSGSGAGITGLTSGQITTALGYTPLPNRSFGTAANNNTNDFVLNQNSYAQSANLWISGKITITEPSQRTRSIGFEPGTSNFRIYDESFGFTPFKLDGSGAATFASTVSATGFLLNGNNLTSALSTNYIPKWNGSNFVNSLISDENSIARFTGLVSAFPSSGNGTEIFNSTSTESIIQSYNRSAATWNSIYIRGAKIDLYSNGNVGLSINPTYASVPYTTASTSSTTGALVVGGGVGADHVRANNFYGNGSNLTGVQAPITLTTNGTSGAATFSGNVLNVPNYSSGNFIQNQYTSAQNGSLWINGYARATIAITSNEIRSDAVWQSINASTSGVINAAQPFTGASYKKVLVYLDHMSGTATYTFAAAFTTHPVVLLTTGLPSTKVTSLSSTSVTVTGSNDTGLIILEGY